MIRDWYICDRLTEARTQYIAYVENFQPRSGSNFSAARISAMIPSCIKSPALYCADKPFRIYVFTTLCTIRKLDVTNLFFASIPSSSACPIAAILIFPAAAHHSSSVGSRPSRSSNDWNKCCNRIASCVFSPNSISSFRLIRSS